MCMVAISAAFVLELLLFLAVFLLLRLRPPWSGRITAWMITACAVLFLASFAFLVYLGFGYGCG
jgi:hypothetical protein